MKKSIHFTSIAVLVLAGLFALSSYLPTVFRDPLDLPAGNASEDLQSLYGQWSTEYRRYADRLVIPLGWSKGLSAQFTGARGLLELDRRNGSVSVRIDGLVDRRISEVWLVDNQPGPGRSVRPEPGDVLLRIGSLSHDRDGARLETALRSEHFGDFEVDLVVIARTSSDPRQEGVLFGVPSLFQRISGFSKLQAVTFDPAESPTSLAGFLRQDPLGDEPVEDEPAIDFTPLVEHGRELFFAETFDGNGRTCGTCHSPKNNFTLDPEFIATLPASDPLFVAEFTPELAENFEKPILMRELGLILENQDGFDDLENKFVMRAVIPTTALGLQGKALPLGIDGTTIPPKQRTGWGGDGAPGSGTLREFPIGAIVQHFTRSLERIPGQDFRLPTDEELDALEAFQLTLGRRRDLNLATLRPTGDLPAEGRRIFRRLIPVFGPAGKCNACHGNAGARDSVVPGGFTINFNTGVEDLPDQPADRLDPLNPPDGGFGTEPDPDTPGAFGNGTFSTPSIVESADTGPFFHNHSVQTIEESVDFYNSDAFNNSPIGRLIGGIELEPEEVQAVGAFLRVINAVENIRHARALQTGKQRIGFNEDEDLGIAVAELEDAVEVLEEASLHSDAVARLRQAIVSTQAAIVETDPEARRVLIEQALFQEKEARRSMVRISLF